MSHNLLEKPAGDYLQQLVDEFKAQNPNITVEIETVPNSDVVTKLTAYAQANDLPDIIDANGGASNFSSVNAALDITDMVKAAGMEEQYFRAYLEGGRNADGRLIGLPLFAGAEALYYRTDYFEQAGLDPKKPPKTWDELVDAAKKLTDRSKGRSGFGIYGKSQTQRMFNFTKPAGPDGDVLAFDKQSGKWSILLNSPASQKGWQFLVDLNTVHKVAPPNVLEMDYPANISAFAAGSEAMLTSVVPGARRRSSRQTMTSTASSRWHPTRLPMVSRRR